LECSCCRIHHYVAAPLMLLASLMLLVPVAILSVCPYSSWHRLLLLVSLLLWMYLWLLWALLLLTILKLLVYGSCCSPFLQKMSPSLVFEDYTKRNYVVVILKTNKKTDKSFAFRLH
jgi:hypothetical protein